MSKTIRTDASDRSVKVSRDAIGNTIITGDNNRVVVYQIRTSVTLEEESPAPQGLSKNPYRGLEAFDENDSDRFFGRARETSDLWDTLYRLDTAPDNVSFTGRVLPIVGGSGSGKSSLARAGLIAELARRPWPGRSPASVAIMVPGERPLEALAAAMIRVQSKRVDNIAEIRELSKQLATPGPRGDFDGLCLISRAAADRSHSIVLLIDQFEEAFSICSDEIQRNAFIENLRVAAMDTSGTVKTVLTLRTDFLPQVQHVNWLNQAITYNGYIVPKMEEEALRAAISEPARRSGYNLDASTVDLLVQQTRGRDGALPLLQFALSQIWQGISQSPPVPPADTLRNIGGIGGALATEAQRQFDILSEPERAIAKRAFVAGVQLGEPGQETRRRFGTSEIVVHGQTNEDVLRVIRRFSTRDARLLTLFTSLQKPETQIEITHETLISEWPALRDWVKNTREDILFHRDLAEAANAYNAKTGGLWRSPELDRLREFHRRAHNEFTSLEIAFYKASETHEYREKLARRVAITLLLIAVIVASILAVWAHQQQNRAQREALVDRANQLAAESRAALAPYPERSLLLALEAERLGTDAASPEQALRDALQSVDGHGLGRTRTSPVKDAFLAANDQWLIFKTAEKVYLRAMPTETNPAPFSRFLAYAEEFSDLDSSPDHRWLVTGRVKDGVSFWDLNTQRFPTSIIFAEGRLHAFTPDSRWFVASHEGHRQLRIWSLKPKFSPTPVVVPLEADVAKVVTSNSTVVAILTDGSACELNLSAIPFGCKRLVLAGATSLDRADLSSDGRVLIGAIHTKATWNGGTRVSAWSLGSSTVSPQPEILLEDVARIEQVAISKNSRWVAVTTATDLNTGNGGLIHLWNVQQSPPKSFLLDQHRGNVTTLLFSPDDNTLVSTSWDGTARIWNLNAVDPSASPVILRGHSSFVTSAAFDPTGQWLATGGSDQSVIQWDMKGRDIAATGRVFRGMEGAVSRVFFSNDGLRLLAGSDDGALRYWDQKRTRPSADPDVVPVQLGHSDSVTGITFTHDMRWAFTYEGDHGEVFTLRRVTPERRFDAPIRIPFTLETYSLDGGFSNDSRWLAISDQNRNTTKLYDLSSDDPLHHERDLAGVFPGFLRRDGFSPDSKWLITFDAAAKHLNAWDLTSPAVAKHQLAESAASTNFDFSADGRWLLSLQDTALHAIDLQSPNLEDRVLAQDLPDDSSDIWFTPSGNRVAYVSAEASLVIVDPEGKVGATVGPSLGGNVRVERSSDRTRLLVVSDDAVKGGQSLREQLQRKIASQSGSKSEFRLTLFRWVGKQYDRLSSETTVEGELELSTFSPHSRWLLTATHHDTNPILWDMESEDPFSHPTRLWGHTILYNHRWEAAFTSDEHWLATTGDSDPSVHLWNLRSCQIDASVVSLGGLGGSVAGILFSSDNKQLLCRVGGGLRLWRMNDEGVSGVALNLGNSTEHMESFDEAMFSPTNDELVAWGGERVRFWSLRLPILARKAESAAGRNFTWEEWALFFPGQDYSKDFPDLPVDASVVSGLLDQAHLYLLKGNTQKAQKLYENAAKWSDEIGDPSVSNDVAWAVATDNMATFVASAADSAVQMDPNNGEYLDTRALVRALRGDREGAIKDYEAYLQWARNQEHEPLSDEEKREVWLAALKSGSNPFNEELLRSLRDD